VGRGGKGKTFLRKKSIVKRGLPLALLLAGDPELGVGTIRFKRGLEGGAKGYDLGARRVCLLGGLVETDTQFWGKLSETTDELSCFQDLGVTSCEEGVREHINPGVTAPGNGLKRGEGTAGRPVCGTAHRGGIPFRGWTKFFSGTHSIADEL